MLLLPPPLPRPIPVLPCLLGAPSPSFCLQHHFPFSWAFCERPGNWSPDSLGTRFPGWVSAWSPPLVLSPQLLEYLGKGKSIVDVGLAQARRPLSTRSHYFEVEIVALQYSCLENLHGQRSLARYCPWGHKELNMTERLSTHMYLGKNC